MREWLTAREIAAENLPDMPRTESAIIRKAKRDSWDVHPTYARRREALGGGIEYHYRILPSLAQIAYFQRHTVVGAAGPSSSAADPAAEVAAGAELTERARLERDARIAILAAFELFARGLKLNQQACIQLFCDRYEMGNIKVDAWVKELVPSVGRRTFYRWLGAKRSGEIDKLAVDRSSARAGKGLLDIANGGDVRNFILAWIAQNPALSAETIRGYVELEYGSNLKVKDGAEKPLPPVRTFQHFIAGLKAAETVVLTKITNPDHYRSNLKLRGTGSYSWVNEVNHLWMIDASPGDALLLDGRHSIYVCIDVASRTVTALVSKTPRASAVGLMMRKAMLANGVCHAVKTDNGSDFVAQETKRLFTAMGLEILVSQKYTPEEKAFVERAIKTIQHGFFTQLPGYVGHNVAERKAIEERKSFADRLGEGDQETFSISLTAADLQQKLDDWLELVYHQRAHDGLRKRSPAEVVAASMAPIRRIDERALDVLLMPVAGKNGVRRMSAQGIKINENYYLTGAVMTGTDVFVRMDTQDMGKAYLFSIEDGRFITTAICPKLSDVNPAEFVRAQKQQFNDMVSTRERQIRRDVGKILKGPSGIDRTIELARKKADNRAADAANVIQLPKREETHSTPQIAAALDAAMASDQSALLQSRKLDERMSDIMKTIEADLAPHAAQGNVRPIRSDATPQQRFRAARDIELLLDEGATVEPERLLWLGSYQQSAEYKTQRGLWEAFGDQAPVLGS